MRLAVEDQSEDLGWTEQGESLFEQLAGSFVGSDDDHISIDPFREQAAVWSGKHRRSIHNNAVIPLTRIAKKLAESAGREQLIRISLWAARRHNRKVERLKRPGDLLETQPAIEDCIHQTPATMHVAVAQNLGERRTSQIGVHHEDT